MKLNAGSISIECIQQQSFGAQLTKGLVVTSGKRTYERNKPFRSQTFGGKGALKLYATIRRSSSESFFYDQKRFPKKLHSMRSCSSENFDNLEGGLELNGTEDLHTEEPCSSSPPLSPNLPSITTRRLQESDSFLRSSVDILDPVALGIKPEAPSSWPERESIRWIKLEHEANSFAVPNSLRMIQKKMRLHKGLKVLLEESDSSSSIRKAFSSMMFIMFELQSSVLKARETKCREDLEMIIDKVQSDMQSSYARLFQQVFSRTPALMIDVILLLANFSLHSTSLSMAVPQSPLSASETATTIHHQSPSTHENYSSTEISDDDNALCEKEVEETKEDELTHSDFSSKISKTSIQDVSAKETQQQGDSDLRSVAEMLQWNSFLEEATKMRTDAVLDHDLLRRFVSPISVLLEETDNYLEYSEIDMRYKIGVSREPNNPLLLCNYAKFLLYKIDDPERYLHKIYLLPPDYSSFKCNI